MRSRARFPAAAVERNNAGCSLKNPRCPKLIRGPPLRRASWSGLVLARKTPERKILRGGGYDDDQDCADDSCYVTVDSHRAA